MRRPAAAALLVMLAMAGCGQSSQARSEGRATAGGAPEAPAIRITTAVAEGRAVQRSVETVGSLLA